MNKLDLEKELGETTLPGVEGDFLTRVHFERADGENFNRPVTPNEGLTRGLAPPSAASAASAGAAAAGGGGGAAAADQLPDPPSIGDLDLAGLPSPSRDASLKAPPVKRESIVFDHSGNQGKAQRNVRKESYENYEKKKAAGKIDIANAGKIRKGHESRKQTADKRPREGGEIC